MLLRKIRLTGLISCGAVLALVALLWIYFFDVSVKSEAKWLYMGLCFGVIGGVFGVYGGYLSNDEGKPLSLYVLSLALILDVLFVVFLLIAHFDNAVISSATRYGFATQFKIINIITIVISILSCVCLGIGIGLDVLAKLESKKEDKIINEQNLL